MGHFSVNFFLLWGWRHGEVEKRILALSLPAEALSRIKTLGICVVQ